MPKAKGLKLLLVGATGAVGKEVLRQALAAPGVAELLAVTRRPVSKPSGVKSGAHFVNVVVDFAVLPDKPVWCQVDGVVCTLGTTIKVAGSKQAFAAVDLDLPVQIAAMAQAGGATRFALNSSLGALASSPSFYLRTKGECENQIRELGYASLTIVRPSLIDAERENARPGELAGLLAARLFGPLIPRQYRPVTASAIAGALLDGVLAGKPGTEIVESRELHKA